MDYSSYPQRQDDEQQQQQQPQPRQYHYQYHQQQNHQSYDSSQYQPFSDHLSYQAYYSYSHHHRDDQQYYNYYHDYHANSYAQQQHQDHAIIHPPGVVPPPPESDKTLLFPHGNSDPGQCSDPSSGCDPAAVVSQMTQFSGIVPIGQTPYRGGRRGNRPFRGGRGHYGRHGRGPGGPRPSSFRGRGRGWGGSGHLGPQGAASAPAQAIGEAAALALQQPQPLPVAPQVPTTQPQRPPHVAFCELCRVDCNSQEILEQHKNGKKHKKNLQVSERLQKLNKANAGQQNAQMPNTELKPFIGVQPEKVNERNQPSSDNSPEVMTNNNNSNNTEEQRAAVVVDKSEASAEDPETKKRDQFPARGRGGKRKMRGGGRGGKYSRVDDGSRIPTELPRHKQVVPLVCELCNVKCDTQIVFDTHLSGKKHRSNLKRFHSNQGFYQESALNAHPSTSVTPQGSNDPQVILAQLLMTYVLSQAQAPGSSVKAQGQPDLQTQGSDPIPPGQANQNALTTEIRSQLESLIAICNNTAAPAWDTSNKAVNQISDVAVTRVHVPAVNSVVVPGESSGINEPVSGAVSDQALSSQQCEVVYTGAVGQPEEPDQ